MRVNLHPRGGDVGAFQVLRRCRAELAEAGFTLDDKENLKPSPGDADLWVLHQKFAGGAILDSLPDRSVILMERIDSSQLWSRRAAEHPAVMCCAKPSTLGMRLLNTRYLRHHESLLIGEDAEGVLDAISDDAATKVIPGPNLGQYNRVARFLGVDPNLDGPRPLDVFFAGSVDIYQDAICVHRRQCCRTIESLRCGLRVQVVPSKSLSRYDYDHRCRSAKIVVSPWGNGELCHRDFDAMWCGAVIVKPGSDHIRTDPQLFINGKTYFACQPDWSDLADVVRDVIYRWDELHEMRRSNYRMAVRCWQPSSVVDWFNRTLNSN